LRTLVSRNQLWVAILGSLIVLTTGAAALRAMPAGNASSTRSIHASWAAEYSTLPELKAHTDVVVRGKITKVTAQYTVKTIPFTDFQLTLSQVIYDRGHLLSSSNAEAPITLTLHQTGGVVGGVTYQVDDDPLFTIGEECVLFLKEYKPGFYGVIGGPTGRFTVVNGQVSSIANEGLQVSTSVDDFAAQVQKP